MMDINSFDNYCQFPDGSIDWIDCPYPCEIADLFGEKQPSQDDICFDNFEQDDGLSDDSDIEEEGKAMNENI